MNNIIDLCQFVTEAVTTASNDRRNKVPVKDGTLLYTLLIDLKKAFDQVDRQLLVTKLTQRGFSPTLTSAIAHMLS